MQDATLRQRSQKRDDAARLANNHGERRLLESSENRFVIKITICVSWQELKSRSLPHAESPSSRDRAAGRRSEAQRGARKGFDLRSIPAPGGQRRNRICRKKRSTCGFHAETFEIYLCPSPPKDGAAMKVAWPPAAVKASYIRRARAGPKK